MGPFLYVHQKECLAVIVLPEPHLYRERDLPDVVEHGLTTLRRFAVEARNTFLVGTIIAVILGVAVAVGVHFLSQTSAAL